MAARCRLCRWHNAESASFSISWRSCWRRLLSDWAGWEYPMRLRYNSSCWSVYVGLCAIVGVPGFLAVRAVLEGYMNCLYPRLSRSRIGIIPFAPFDDQCWLGSPHSPPHPRLPPRQWFIVSGHIRKMLLFHAQFLCYRQPAQIDISIYSYRIMAVIIIYIYIYRRMRLSFSICSNTRTTVYFQQRWIVGRPIWNSRSLLYCKIPASNWRK